MRYKSILTNVTLVALALIIGFNVYLSRSEKRIDVNLYSSMQIEDPVMLTLFSLKTPEPWLIELPDSNVRFPLTRISQTKTHNLALGDYQNMEERGTIALDFQKLTPVNVEASSRNMWFVVPFSVTSQGSGHFWYLGLFELDVDEAQVKQIDSAFIGDRVRLETLTPEEPFDVSESVRITFFSFGPDQAYSEEPEVEVTWLWKLSMEGFLDKEVLKFAK